MKRCFGERGRHTSSVGMLRGRQLTGNSLLLMLVLSCIVFIHRDHRDELLAYLRHLIADKSGPNSLSSWMKQESERLQRYGLENEAVEKLLHEVIVNNEDE